MKPISKTVEDGVVAEKFQKEVEDQNEEVSTTLTIEKIYHKGEEKNRWYHLNIKAWAHMGSGLETQMDLYNLAPSELRKLGNLLLECARQK